MDRRAFLKSSSASAAVIAALPWHGALAAPAKGWRRYEITTQVEIVEPRGVSRAWIPLPAVDNTDWHQSLGNAWTGNAQRMEILNDGKYGVAMLYAEWPAGGPMRRVMVTSRVRTRERTIDALQRASGIDRPAADRAFYTMPTEMIPTDGIVRKTSLDITRGAKTDVEKARAIYEWIVEN